VNRARPSQRRRRWPRLDLLSIILAPLGVVVVVAGHALDGSRLASLIQGPSALVVFGGTLGAILISYTPMEVFRAIRSAVAAFRAPDDDIDTLAATIVTLSIRAHRRGLTALEPDLDSVPDPMLRNGLGLVVDGASPEMLKQVLTLESRAQEADEELPARVLEAAAGYAPTMGILGAVLGLMRVMENLGAPGMLGSGIALAFVATVYGVGLANLVLLPMAGRLRERSLMRGRRRELIVEGLDALQQRTNPRLVAQKVRPFSSRMPRIDELAAHGGLRAARKPGVPA
jgi:chemotaxis protein MotA